MQCRHTVPEWHRYADPETASLPIFAACRLLLTEGERGRDAQSIGCGYWGRQRECPLYEGPGGRLELAPPPRREDGSRGTPVAGVTVWPVRNPDAADGFRRLVSGLGLLSIALLSWSLVLGGLMLGGLAEGRGFAGIAVVAAGVSLVTHLLAALRAWAGR
jgi:hypothetical protein